MYRSDEKALTTFAAANKGRIAAWTISLDRQLNVKHSRPTATQPALPDSTLFNVNHVAPCCHNLTLGSVPLGIFRLPNGNEIATKSDRTQKISSNLLNCLERMRDIRLSFFCKPDKRRSTCTTFTHTRPPAQLSREFQS